MKRRTYTSPEVKNRWNAKHYDRIQLNAPKGSADELKYLAELRGMSVSAYIRHLVIADNSENPENTRFLRGGGVADLYEAMKDESAWSTPTEAIHRIMNVLDGEDPGQLWI